MMNKIDKKEIKLILNAIGGLIVIITGIAMICITKIDVQFNCIRTSETEGQCKYLVKDAFGIDHTEFDLAKIKEVEVLSEEECEDGICDMYYSAELKTNNDESYNISNNETNSGTEINKYAEEINEFLIDPEQQELKATFKENSMTLLLLTICGVLFILSGAGYSIFNIAKAVLFSKGQNRPN